MLDRILTAACGSFSTRDISFAIARLLPRVADFTKPFTDAVDDFDMYRNASAIVKRLWSKLTEDLSHEITDFSGGRLGFNGFDYEWHYILFAIRGALKSL